MIIGAVASGVGALTNLGMGIAGKRKANKQAAIEKEKARKLQQRLENFEKSRQQVLDQSGDIRALKSQVFNPYANLGVATKATDLKIQQTDEALANTLESINQSGTGAGGATALARMAAASKAQVSATLENQEANNQKLRMEGEAQAVATKMALEQKALGAEAQTWQLQEGRDLATLDRLSGLQENAQAQQLAYEAGGDQMLMSGMQGFTQGLGSLGSSLMGMQGGSDSTSSGGGNQTSPSSTGYNSINFMNTVAQPITLGSNSQLLNP